MVQRMMLVAGFVASVACQRGAVQGSGRVVEEGRTVPAFSALEVANGIRVEATVGGPQRVRVRADDNVVPLVRTEVRGDTLAVSMAPNSAFRASSPVVVAVTAPALTRVAASSGSEARVAGAAGESVQVESSSGGSAIVTGHATRVQAQASSGARVDTTALRCERASVSASSGARAAVFASAAVAGSVSSGASVHVVGAPAERAVSESSGGSVSFQ